MEWFQERTESVFNSVSLDSIKEAMADTVWMKAGEAYTNREGYISSIICN